MQAARCSVYGIASMQRPIGTHSIYHVIGGRHGKRNVFVLGA